MKQIEQTLGTVHSFDAVGFVFTLLSRLSIYHQCLVLKPGFALYLYLSDQNSSFLTTIVVSEMNISWWKLPRKRKLLPMIDLLGRRDGHLNLGVRSLICLKTQDQGIP